jgi:agmatinase
MIPHRASVFITLDCDGLDPSVMPGVAAPVPGGLGYWQVVALLEGLASRTRIAGFDIVELVPERDAGGQSALMAARLVTLVIGAIQRAGA